MCPPQGLDFYCQAGKEAACILFQLMNLTRERGVGAGPDRISFFSQMKINKSLLFIWGEIRGGEKNQECSSHSSSLSSWKHSTSRKTGSLKSNQHLLSGNFSLFLSCLFNITILTKTTLDLGLFSFIFPATWEKAFSWQLLVFLQVMDSFLRYSFDYYFHSISFNLFSYLLSFILKFSIPCF